MYRRRGRSVGTFMIGAIVLLAVIYSMIVGWGSSTMRTPYLIGTAEPSHQ